MDRIRKKDEYDFIYKNGQKYFGRYIIIYIIKDNNQEEFLKTGFVASKKTGNAVIRNRIKRLLRTCFRINEKKINKKSKIVVIAKRRFGEEIKEMKLDKINKDVLITLKKANMI